VKVTWDPEKAMRNLAKHKVSFSDAESVLFDPLALTVNEEIVNDERRYATIGMDGFMRILVVVYVYRGDDVRMISARRATNLERKNYEEGI